MIPPRVESAVSELEIEIEALAKRLAVAEERGLLLRDALCAYDYSMVQIKEARYTPTKTLAEAAKAADTLIGTATVLFGVGDGGET